MPRSRTLTLAALVVAFCALAGGAWGRGALEAQDQGVIDQYEVFSSALGAIEEHYVGDFESERLVYGAITGMLQTLDPHSSFMDPRQFQQMQERQEGRYGGLGISINVVDGDVTIFNVFEGSPAHESGLRRGDVIARIEGEDAKGWTSTQAVEHLRGERGTSVNISIRRPGYDDLIDMSVRRDEVRIPTVPAAVMLDATTGYIKLQDFGENTNRELGAALENLTERGMTRLVFDLRGNPGGALDQAIRVSNRFLPKDDLIVYTRGRVPNSDQDYRADQVSAYLELPMVTLVNRTSASASEIVAGALQDHDRSLIVGETTIGKALVQSVYRLAHGAGAAITTAHYYTPSGRMIQRPWDDSFDEYLTYTFREQATDATHDAQDLKYTDAGRPVYAGGGIEPDERFDGPEEGFSPTPFGRAIFSRGLFEAFAQRFTRRGDDRVPPGAARPLQALDAGFEVTGEMLAEFEQLVRQSTTMFDEDAWKADRDYIVAMIHREIDVDLFGVATAHRNLARRDPMVTFAIEQFPAARQLLELSQEPDNLRVAR
jgi:carboxyl-terminal processing protease